MHKRAAILAIILAFLGANRGLRADQLVDGFVYVPFVAVRTALELGPGGEVASTWWYSTISAFNLGTATATYRYDSVYGRNLSSPDSDTCRSGVVDALTGREIERYSGCVVRVGSDSAGFIRFAVSGDLVISSRIERVVFNQSCQSAAPKGGLFLPVFTTPSPAGSTSLFGEIDLGNPRLSTACAPAEERLPRRLNATLLCLREDAPCTFTITARVFSGVPTVQFERVVSVGPGRVAQLDDLRTLSSVAEENIVSGGVRQWMTVSADGPYLAYLSTVLIAPIAGAVPFEVYAPQAIRGGE